MAHKEQEEVPVQSGHAGSQWYKPQSIVWAAQMETAL